MVLPPTPTPSPTPTPTPKPKEPIEGGRAIKPAPKE